MHFRFHPPCSYAHSRPPGVPIPCGMAPSHVGATLTYENPKRIHGSTATYKCDTGYKGADSIIMCTSGSWTVPTINVSCTQGRWLLFLLLLLLSMLSLLVMLDTRELTPSSCAPLVPGLCPLSTCLVPRVGGSCCCCCCCCCCRCCHCW